VRKTFKDEILELAKTDDKIILVFGDISVFLFREFANIYPKRFYNMGICENTLISMAGRLSSQGFIPFVHTIAPFIAERSYEQIKLDLCYNQFGANILTCGSSFDYAWDGATHHCYTDLALMRMLPNIEVIQPGSKNELKTFLRSQYKNGKVTYFKMSDFPHEIEDISIEFGRAYLFFNKSAPLTIMTAGPILANVLEACRDLNVNLVYFPTIKPIDQDVIQKFRTTKILVIHDGFGLYEAISTIPDLKLEYHGLPDKFCTWYGTVHDIRKKIGLDPAGIRKKITFLLEKKGVLNV